MWNIEQKRGGGRRAALALALALLAVAGLTACRRDMQDQPKYEPLSQSAEGGTSSRAPVENTVARGQLRDNLLLYSGRLAAGQTAPAGQGPAGSQNAAGGQQGSVSDAAAGQAPASGQIQQSAMQNSNIGGASGTTQGVPGAGFANVFPFPVTQAVLDRGQERFNIYCSVCHGMTGAGDGMVVRRGFRRPLPLYEDRLKQAPAGYFFDVITNGFGVMPSYAEQVSVRDRWAIVAYLRALQLSQNARLEDVPADKRGELEKGRQQ